MSRANILLVDDVVDNLVALEAILEPLDQTLVRATSGTEALKCLLERDFAFSFSTCRCPESTALRPRSTSSTASGPGTSRSSS